MSITKELTPTWKEDKALLRNSVSALKKSMTDYKAERKSEWKSFKTKIRDDMENIEKSLERLIATHKK